ncbi:GNAT family N-acetyltransferase [Bowmanella yangjiangensis]|uniref:GNAT family N-acetyltransferase n=1 Tax=Bowmanella yangjiangensis TaxID=2811230 RepID=A0ABS3CTJ5_9ALTE|nr:GNAT family N-acetyltransferase [Bowmanella yangjiangensis]
MQKLVSKIVALDEVTNQSGQEWEALIERFSFNPSMRPGWIACCSAAFSQPVKVMMFYKDQRLVGALPFYVSARHPGRIEAAGNMVSYHQQLIVEPEFTHDVLCTLRDNMAEMDLSMLSWVGVTKDAQLLQALQSDKVFGYLEMVGDSSPFMPLKEDWKTILSAKSRKVRYKINHRQKELEGRPELQVRRFEQASPELLEMILFIEQKSWKVDAGMDISSNQRESSYYEKLLPWLAAQNKLWASVLLSEGQPIAYNLCYRDHGVVGQMKTSFDNDFNDISPGAMLVEDDLRLLIDQGYQEFDFLGDIMPHKMIWCNDVREHLCVHLYPNTFKGQVAFFSAKLRRWFKATFLRVKGKE